MRIDSFDVYEPPVAEEVNLVVESPIANGSGNVENPDPCPTNYIDIG